MSNRSVGHAGGQLKGQLTLRGIIIGCVGCVIITAASVYTALKMGVLPWPIIFAAIVSLFFLKALGRTSLNEANVTHTVMSAGAMVAGGLAFTIPGIWMLGHASEVSWWQMLVVALAGVALGLVCTILLRRHFVEKAGLPFPIGQAAAQTLIAGDSGGRTGAKLFGALGLAGVYTFLRDGLKIIPAMLFDNIAIPGVAFGIYNSPMLLAVGFLVGTGAVVVWFLGALLGSFGIVAGASALGWWDVTTGQGISSSLGMGVMMGAGIGVIVKIALGALRSLRRIPTARETPAADHRGSASTATGSTSPAAVDSIAVAASAAADPIAVATASPPPLAAAEPPFTTGNSYPATKPRTTAALATLVMAAVALLICFALDLGPLVSLIVVVFVWVTTAMSSQSVGQTGIDPMELFGLIVLLIVAAFASATLVQLFFVAGIIAVACGLAGDVMNDFKAGYILGTNPRAQWIGQAIGGVLGAVVAVAVLVILLAAYGPEAFGSTGSFVSTQASIVKTMVSGIPSIPAFAIGLVAGLVLALTGAPAMMLGLGIYLPFYLSFSAFLGALAKVVYDRICVRRRAHLPDEQRVQREQAQAETGLILASGLLGGESVVGVLIALGAIFL
ncbi:MAG: OPT/YSL family transporter [Coriobacteriales bacterium]|nr:OPT/YSL family transporter [Coriobacteriales bacterium]